MTLLSVSLADSVYVLNRMELPRIRAVRCIHRGISEGVFVNVCHITASVNMCFGR